MVPNQENMEGNQLNLVQCQSHTAAIATTDLCAGALSWWNRSPVISFPGRFEMSLELLFRVLNELFSVGLSGSKQCIHFCGTTPSSVSLWTFQLTLVILPCTHVSSQNLAILHYVQHSISAHEFTTVNSAIDNFPPIVTEMLCSFIQFQSYISILARFAM